MSSSRKPEGGENSTNMYKLLLTERKKVYKRKKSELYIQCDTYSRKGGKKPRP